MIRLQKHLAALLGSLLPLAATAGTTVFFDPSQIATLVATGTTSDAISSEGYVFTYTRDKLFTGGTSEIIGRPVRIPWPDGLEAQYVTAGPQPTKASIMIQREDGALFDLTAFTARLLANAGAGRAIEIVPLLNGEEPLNDPLYFDVSGNYGNEFSYDVAPNPLGSTAALTNYDAYKINLTLDYALTALTLESAAPNGNHAPADMALSNSSVFENESIGTVVGSLSTTDPDAGDTFTYALVAGAGDADNGSFSISGSDLLTAASFNFEIRSNYSVRVQAEDQGGLSTQKILAIGVADLVEPPPKFSDSGEPLPGAVVIRWSSLSNHWYTLYHSTNLLEGFTAVETNIPATPELNSFTNAAMPDQPRFWMLSTGP